MRDSATGTGLNMRSRPEQAPFAFAREARALFRRVLPRHPQVGAARRFSIVLDREVLVRQYNTKNGQRKAQQEQ